MYELEKVWMATFGIVVVSTIIGNLLFLVVFFKRAKLRRRRTSLLLISLTAADLIVGAVAIPMCMAILWSGSEVENSKAFIQSCERIDILSALRRSYEVIDVLSGFASLFGLAVIALERVYSIFWPRQHHSLSKTPYRVALVTSWFLAAVLAIPKLARDENLITSNECFYFNFSYMIAVLIIIAVSYSAMWMKIKTNRSDVVHQRRIKRERKLSKTLTILTGVFLITWLPSFAIYAVLHLGMPCSYKVPLDLVLAAKFPRYANSPANPVLYSLRFPEVRRTLGNICSRKQMAIRGRERGGN